MAPEGGCFLAPNYIFIGKVFGHYDKLKSVHLTLNSLVRDPQPVL